MKIAVPCMYYILKLSVCSVKTYLCLSVWTWDYNFYNKGFWQELLLYELIIWQCDQTNIKVTFGILCPSKCCRRLAIDWMLDGIWNENINFNPEDGGSMFLILYPHKENTVSQPRWWQFELSSVTEYKHTYRVRCNVPSGIYYKHL
jgi:hypothetical protein